MGGSPARQRLKWQPCWPGMESTVLCLQRCAPTRSILAGHCCVISRAPGAQGSAERASKQERTPDMAGAL